MKKISKDFQFLKANFKTNKWAIFLCHIVQSYLSQDTSI